MPSVPGYGGRRVAPTPFPNARRQGRDTYESLGGPQAEGLAAFGQSLSRAMPQLTQIVNEQRARADQVRNLSTTRSFLDLETRLMDDPEHGALTVKGLAAMENRDTVLETFDKEAASIGTGLKSHEQQIHFETERMRRRAGILEGLDKHASSELQAYEQQEVTATLATSINTAVAHADDPQRIKESLETIAKVVEQHGARLGLGAAARQEALDKMRSQVHTGVIARLLSLDREDAAQVYFDELKEQISADQVSRIQEALKGATREKQALVAAEDIWGAHAPGNDTDPISIDQMETVARERFADKPDVLKATIGYLRERKAGVDNGRKERADARDDAVWTAVMGGTPFAQIRRMPQYIAMDGKAQTQLRDYYNRQTEHQASLAYQAEARANAAEGRRYTAMLREEKLKELNGWASYFELADPNTLRTASRADILRQLPQLGDAHVQRLLNDQEQLSRNDAALKAATIDHDEFVSAAVDAGLAYATAPKKPEEKANIAKLEDAAKDEIAKQQGAKGRVLTREEKQTIVRGVIDNKVMLKDAGWFWFDAPTPAAVVSGTERGNAYVPVDTIPAPALREGLNYLRGLPGNAALSDAQLRARYQDRLERAYALTLTHGSRAEVEQALKGR